MRLSLFERLLLDDPLEVFQEAVRPPPTMLEALREAIDDYHYREGRRPSTIWIHPDAIAEARKDKWFVSEAVMPTLDPGVALYGRNSKLRFAGTLWGVQLYEDPRLPVDKIVLIPSPD